MRPKKIRTYRITVVATEYRHGYVEATSKREARKAYDEGKVDTHFDMTDDDQIEVDEVEE